MSKRNLDRTNWLGVCLLVIGIIYLNRHYHWEFIHIQNWLPPVFFGWQAILIGLGCLLLLFGRGAGLTLIFIGVFFLFTSEIFHAIGNFYQWWPLALIIVGLVLLSRSSRVGRSKAND